MSVRRWRPCSHRSWTNRLLHRWFTCHQREPGPDPSIVGAGPVLTERRRAQVIASYHAGTTRTAREATIALVRAGVHLGPAPYGYRIHRVASAAVTAGSRSGVRSRRRLVPDPPTASVVPVIFSWRVDEHLSTTAIVARLAADPVHCPPPLDPTTGRPRPWTARMVQALLSNPVYTGRTVWGRTRHGQRVPVSRWVISPPGAHRALVDEQTFARVAATFTSRAAVA